MKLKEKNKFSIIQFAMHLCLGGILCCVCLSGCSRLSDDGLAKELKEASPPQMELHRQVFVLNEVGTKLLKSQHVTYEIGFKEFLEEQGVSFYMNSGIGKESKNSFWMKNSKPQLEWTKRIVDSMNKGKVLDMSLYTDNNKNSGNQ